MPRVASSLPQDLLASLGWVVAATRSSQDPWWIIGSAAMAMHGAGDLDVGDVDLLMSRNDASRVLRKHGLRPRTDGGTDRFRSDIFGRVSGLPLPVDVMGGFHIREDGAWREVVPQTRLAFPIPGGLVYMPALVELIDITRRLGRGKDLARAEMLQSLLK